jgi:hypothetical protein
MYRVEQVVQEVKLLVTSEMVNTKDPIHKLGMYPGVEQLKMLSENDMVGKIMIRWV